MMTSDIYVWNWLPGRTAPVVAGRVAYDGNAPVFLYGLSYLENPEAIAIGPDLPLVRGPQRISVGPSLSGVLRDALPDAWGQRVLMGRHTGLRGRNADTAELPDEWYMLESDSQRFGALDFQESPTEYVPRGTLVDLDDLHRAAEIIDRGGELPLDLDSAIRHGTSIGGARPKAQLVDTDGVHWIAKFPSSTDLVRTVQVEAAALFLAARAGLDVPEHRLVDSLNRKVLLVRRFDRDSRGGRHGALSMLSTLGLNEMGGRHATYPEFLDQLDATSADAEELFRRVALNIAIGNVDDHARNHAALWDGKQLKLAPLYDVDPTSRPGGWDANQAIAYGRDGSRVSNLAVLHRAHSGFRLSGPEAREAIGSIIDAVESGWRDAVDFAQLSGNEAAGVRDRAVLHPAALEGFVRTR